MNAHKQYQLLDPGEVAPGFRLSRLGGGVVSLAELTTHGSVLLAFYKVTCPVCQLTLPFLERLHASGKLAVWAVSQNSPEDTEEFNREYSLSMPTLLDTEETGYPASNDYGISHVPTLYLVGKNGRIDRVIEGWNKKDIEAVGSSVQVRVVRPDDNVPAMKAG